MSTFQHSILTTEKHFRAGGTTGVRLVGEGAGPKSTRAMHIDPPPGNNTKHYPIETSAAFSKGKLEGKGN